MMYVIAWCAVFGLSFYFGTTGDSAAAVVCGGFGMALSAYELAAFAFRK